MNALDQKPANNLVFSNRLVISQAIAFFFLNFFWGLPGTILMRHICLIFGAIAGLWFIYQYRVCFFKQTALPSWLVFLVFIWATTHLYLFSNDFVAQCAEFVSIWKRATLGAIFAMGFGLAISKSRASIQRVCWSVVFIGLLAPSLIYVAKYLLTNFGAQWGIAPSEYLKLFSGSAPFYIPKTTYVCFCLPALAVALGQLKHNIANHVWSSTSNVIYLLTVPLVLFVFYGENIKNGVVYTGFLFLVFLYQILKTDYKKYWLQKMMLILALLFVGTLFLANHLHSNPSWRTFWMDTKVAFNTDQYDHWKFNGSHGYPNNESGAMVSITNYDRIAWGKVGLQLLTQNPLGYGLIERSFGHLAKVQWPESSLHQSHSGWLDLALGIGIPGVVLILSTLVFEMKQLQNILKDLSQNLGTGEPKNRQLLVWLVATWWILLASLVMWCTTEISQKVYFDSLIFWLGFVSGMLLGKPKRLSLNVANRS